MLQYEIAKSLYEEINEKAVKHPDKEFGDFYQEFLAMAAEYAKTRLSWSFMDLDARREDDASRTIKHNALIARLTAVCRNLGMENIEEIMPDRKRKGDFACYIALFLSLEQR